MSSKTNLKLATDFVRAVEAGAFGDDLDQFYHADVVHTEYPNALAPLVTTRNLTQLKEASIKGRQVITQQTYDIKKSCSTGSSLVLEVFWTGTLAIPLGKLKAGENIEAYFAQFFEFKDGKIYRQRNYDCFMPF
ncbi:MAG: nuclear transport factor 2 family protein [Bacteroidota bacterium]